MFTISDTIIVNYASATFTTTTTTTTTITTTYCYFHLVPQLYVTQYPR